ncbi:MAG: hypothetical protein ACYS99_14140 [Planctomycetota bacterium]|jgi:hypothetical protein
MSKGGSGYERILAVVLAAKAAIRRGEALRGLGRTLVVLGTATVLLAALDNLFRLPSLVRVLLLVGAAAVVLFFFVRGVVLAASRRISDDAVAVRIEEAAGGMENGLINALQLGRTSREGGLSGAFVRAVIARGASLAARFNPGRVVSRRRIGRSLAVGGAALLLVLAYAAILPRHFQNALERYARPSAFVPPVSSTTISVKPGDAAVLRGEPLAISAVTSGSYPSTARILVESGGEEFEPSEMLFDGQGFSFRFDAVDRPFRYRVEAGDASTTIFMVTIAECPAVEALALTYRYPDYLKLPEKAEEDASGDIRAPVGTVVKVVAALSQEVADATLTVGAARPRTMTRVEKRKDLVAGEIRVTESGVWSIQLRNRYGEGNRSPVKHRITAVPDEPPMVEITAPGKDVTVTLPARIDVTVKVRDDHGVKEIALLTQRREGGDVKAVKTWAGEGRNARVVSHAILLPEGALLPGDVLNYRAEGRDFYPFGDHVGRSRTFSIRVISREQQTDEAEAALADLAARLRDLLEKERGVKRDTGDVRQALLSGGLTLSGLPARVTSLSETQSAIGAEMVTVAGDVPPGVPALSEVKGTLLSLAMNEVMSAVRHLQDSRSRGGPSDATRDLGAAEEAEQEIVVKLEALLGRVEGLLDRLKDDPEAFLDEKMDEADPEAALRDAIAKLKKYIREQEEILRQTRELEKKDVDDFTDEDIALLEKLAAQEADLARFLEDLKDDLSKIPDQDFSNSTILKELIEAYSEVELAADALTRKRVEVAVPLEQSALELAESLVENIEKWLPDVRDNLKWNMEEFDGELPEVPMAELPDQLEDLIGELIEEEEDLGDDMEDVSSAWADSLDKGAGWGTSDGPISNMSAQGKTGNTLPNKNEVGGRSGEGRTGRSHGEMVEGEASGKGGRKTPTRLTPDPWEGKAVKDRSKDPLGGATGGGKLAGGSGEGLRGPLPPEVKQDLGRLAGKQVAIRQKAEQLDRALKTFHYPDEELSRSVVLMKELEEALRRGDVAGFSRRHALLVEQMKKGQAEVLAHSKAVRDRSRAVPKEIMREMESVDLAELPEGYRDLLRAYYKILSRGGAK